ncbi:MAG: hypothetical protein A2081_05930 [Elusimicrobia bacterium GWC2_61_19]|nr:MAG: hypothetical protein A2081_05930 [Elusimicrobia bacterium GWC2_61_19]
MKKIATKKEFAMELASGNGKFILFQSSYCPFCLMFLPVFKTSAARAPEAFAAVSTDALPELEDAFSVEVVPTVLYFKDGKLAGRLDGKLGRGLSEKDLDAFIKVCGGPCE